MTEQEPKRIATGLVDHEAYKTETGRDAIPLGTFADGTQSWLEPYLEIDGIQVHPDRLEQYLKRIEEEEKKSKPL